MNLSHFINLEKEKQNQGAEGLFVDLNLAKGLGEVLNIISNLFNIDFIKKEFKSGTFTYVTIKSFLKIKKLFLLKNKTLITCEKKIKEMFDSMNADSQDEKIEFIFQCMRLVEECDQTERSFLYEQIRKVIQPEREVTNYLLSLSIP